jgi:H+/Cl- antiporter ClcA
VIKNIKVNIYLKAFSGGVLIVILTLIFGKEYIGLGLDVISNAINPNPLYAIDIHWYTFLLKTLFTSLSLGSGGSGGIITPIFYIGATSGHAFGTLFSPEHLVLFSALGFVSVLSATTNTPIASIIMAVELFGTNMANYAAISVVIAFLITGHRSVFSSQKLSLRKADNIDIEEGNPIENVNMNMNLKDFNRVKDFGQRLKFRNFKFTKKDKE